MREAAPDRSSELAAGLAAVDERIRSAAESAGRDRADLTLVAVTKTWPATDVAALYELGVRDIGENRDQEAAAKVVEVDRLIGPVHVRDPVRWHFIGQLQRNKARSVAAYATMVHSVDRASLVAALNAAAAVTGRQLAICLQVDLDATDRPGQSGRGGAAPDDIAGLAELVAGSESLRLAGVMAVAPLGRPARPAFSRLRAVSERLRKDHPTAVVISAGMSGDLEAAIAEGATHLRVGSALLGARPRKP